MKRHLLVLAMLLFATGASAAWDGSPPQELATMQSRLDEALASLRKLGDTLAAEAPGDSTSRLEDLIPREGMLSGLGIQRLRRSEPLAWAGWPFPVAGGSVDSLARPVLSLRSYGVFRILSLTLPYPAEGETVWLLDLPLLRTDFAERMGPATLWGDNPKRGGFGILPVEGGRVELDPRRAWHTNLREDGDTAVLDVAGSPFLRFYPLAQSKESLARKSSSAPLWCALPFLALGLFLLFRRGRSKVIRAWAAAAGILGGALLVRGALALAEPGGSIFDPTRFSLPYLGGLLASPGDFLASGFVLFLALFLLRRLSADKDSLSSRPLSFALAILLSLAALALGWSLATIPMANESGDLLFEGLLPSAPGAVLQLGIFFFQLALLLLLLPPARRALRGLPAGMKISALVLLLLAGLAIWRSGPMLLAAFFLGIAVWVPSTRQSRGAGIIWLLLPLILFLGFLGQDALERQQDAYLSALRIREETTDSGRISQSLLLRRILGELAEDRELRTLLASGERLDPGLALSLWKSGPPARLGSEGSLAVYDARGSLRSRFRKGETPKIADRLSTAGRGPEPRISEIRGGSAPGGRDYLHGEIAMLDALGVVGILALDLPRELSEIAAPQSLKAHGQAARLMSALSRISLALAALVLLVGLELLLASTGIYPQDDSPRGIELGFQARLLAFFLLVALLPTALIGVLGARGMLRQMEDGSERAALERVQAARSLLESQVRQEAQDLARSEYVKSFVVSDPMFEMAPRDIGEQARNQIMIFDGQGNIKLDEILRDWDPAEADSFLTALPRDHVVYERTGRNLYAGILLDPPLRHRGARVPLSVFYRMKISAAQVENLAGGIGGYLSLYFGGTLFHSSRAEPFGLGRVPPYLPMLALKNLQPAADPGRALSERDSKGRFLRALLALPGLDGVPAGVLSSQDLSGGDVRGRALRQAMGQVFALASLLLLLALALGGWLSRRIFVPIQRLQLGTRRVAAGDFSERLPETGSDEIGELVSSFNRMTDRLEEAQQELVRKKRLEAWSEMARQVAHEIKNPLTPIKLSVQHMERAWRDRKPNFDAIFSDTVKTLYEQVEILRRIARDFSSFGRGRKLKIERVDLAALAAEVVAPYAGALDIEMPEPEPLPVLADREALRKIILNLVENAREAMRAGGRLEVNWRFVDGGGELGIRDHGSGISEDLRERLFEPYFSTKTSGTGLGLAICAQLTDEMDGRLRLENHPEGGALSLLWLPEAADDHA